MSEHVTIPQLSSATQQVQEWLNDLASRPPFEDPRQACSLLRAVLHAVRDRLTPEEAAHFASQLPMIVRGFYFEGWRPALAPNDFATADEFHQHVRSSLGGPRPPEQPAGLDVQHASRTVLEFLADRVDAGELRHVTAQLPEEIAHLFPDAVVAE
jgi:uncharacterized protein (DUF2267 family)